MTQTINIDDGGELAIPVVELLTGRGFITGKSGSGKSNTASVIVESLLDEGFPVLIVDTDGEYWGLKEQYQILHVGADDECDLQVGPEHAEKLADLALEENIPIILDVSGYIDTDESDELIRRTSKAIFDKEKRLNKPFLMIVEEIHEYLPEGPGLDETGEMLTRIAKRGRKRGLGLCGISQRPADVKKDFITQCDWFVWHRLTWDNDTKVVRRVVGNEYDDVVQELADGEGIVMADFLDEDRIRIQIKRKKTFDAGATPDLGEFERPELKSVSGDLVDELQEISNREEQRQDRIAQLEAELKRKEGLIQDLEQELENARDLRDLAGQMANAFQNTGEGVAQETVDQLVDTKNSLERELAEKQSTIEDLQSRINDLEGELADRPDIGDIETVHEAVERLAESFGVTGDGEAEKWKRKYQQARERAESAEEREPPKVDVLEHPAVKRQVEHLKKMVQDLGEKQLKMLEWFQFYGPGEIADAYFHAGYKRSSSRRHEAAKPLKNAGLIEKVGQGEYKYSLDERVREQFEDNPQIGEEAVEALISKVETAFNEQLQTSK